MSAAQNKIVRVELATITWHRALAVVAIATAALAATCCGSGALTTAPPAHAADANYQLIQEPDAGYAPIIGLISGATRSVRMTMYELTDPAAVNALIDDHNRGVGTRVILDAAFHGRQTNAGTFQQLTDAGVAVRWAPNGVIYHQKTITVNDATAAVGTGNLEPGTWNLEPGTWNLEPGTWNLEPGT
jgi:phosphatidylserine/phosphatidylglycerophosphate/cardiolipin synthase-like enzyme